MMIRKKEKKKNQTARRKKNEWLLRRSKKDMKRKEGNIKVYKKEEREMSEEVQVKLKALFHLITQVKQRRSWTILS